MTAYAGRVLVSLWVGGLFLLPLLLRAGMAQPTSGTPIVSVDISGEPFDQNTGDHVIVAAWGTNVSIFSTQFFYDVPNETINMGFPVDYVVLSGNGSYLTVVGNERNPDRGFTPSTRSWVRLYGPIYDLDGPYPLVYEVELPHSAWSDGSQPVDITRDAAYVVVGTGIVDYQTNHRLGQVYLIETPAVPGPPAMWTYNWQDWIQSVRFSGSGDELAVGAFWTHSWKLFDIPQGGGLTLRCTYFDTIIGDVYYVVSPSYNAEYVAVGQGFANTVALHDDNCALLWSSTQNGQFRRLAMADNGDHFAAAQTYAWEDDEGAFHLFDNADNIPEWTYIPRNQLAYPIGSLALVDAAVTDGDSSCIGGYYTEVYRWEADFPDYCQGQFPDIEDPSFINFANGIVNDIAMTYDGEYSVAGDSVGTLYVFQKAEANPIGTWQN